MSDLSFDWNDKSSLSRTKFCSVCERTESQGALFHYHEKGLSGKYGYKKLGMNCNSCYDKMKEYSGLPYDMLDHVFVYNKQYEAYFVKCKSKNKELTLDEDHQESLVFELIKHQMTITDTEEFQSKGYMEKMLKLTRWFIESIAKFYQVHLRDISQVA